MTDHLSDIRTRFEERASRYDDSEMHRALAADVAAFADLDGVIDVVDVATGTGLVLRALHARAAGLRLTGIDLSGAMLVVAAAELPDAVLIEADATVLPLPDSSADFITCVTGLHLFPDPPAAIAEWRRVLRPGGRVVMATFAVRDATQHGGEERPSYPTHHHLFETPERLAQTVAASGFAVTRNSVWTRDADSILISELTGRPADS